MSFDPNHCGSCSTACPTPANSSAAGICGYQCTSGYGDCDLSSANGCETGLNDTVNCGGCGHTCAAKQGCPSRSCQEEGHSFGNCFCKDGANIPMCLPTGCSNIALGTATCDSACASNGGGNGWSEACATDLTDCP